MTTTTDRQTSNQVTFSTSSPEGEVSANVELGQSLGDVPTWSIQTLNVGPPRSSVRYDEHLRDTVGSSYDWSDELRFDRRTGRLASFVLKTPEAGTLDPSIATSWLALSRQAGIPVLEDRENGFHVDPLDLRWLAEDGSALVVADARMLAADRNSLRLAIGGDVDLLFHHGRYTGWILGRPIAHLVAEPGEEATGLDDARLVGPLRDYLALVVEPNLARMSDEDPELNTALQGLRARVVAVEQDPAARALRSSIDRVLEIFYPG